jgi:hypothetical protein
MPSRNESKEIEAKEEEMPNFIAIHDGIHDAIHFTIHFAIHDALHSFIVSLI